MTFFIIIYYTIQDADPPFLFVLPSANSETVLNTKLTRGTAAVWMNSTMVKAFQSGNTLCSLCFKSITLNIPFLPICSAGIAFTCKYSGGGFSTTSCCSPIHWRPLSNFIMVWRTLIFTIDWNQVPLMSTNAVYGFNFVK